MPLSLFIDLATKHRTIACVDGTRVLSRQSVEEKAPEKELLLIVERTLTEAKKSFSGLTRIAAVIGPGGFMSLRVAAALANALSWSLHVPLAGIHASDLWAARAHSSKLTAQSFFWLHSTKKEALFIRGFGVYAKEWPAPVLISLGELAEKLSARGGLIPYVGELIPLQKAALPMLKEKEEVEHLDDILPTLLSAQSFSAQPLAPWYGRGA